MTDQDRTVLTVSQFLPHPRSRVWGALIDPDQLGAWFMPNDFQPVVGHTFTFRRTPNPALRFSAAIECRVLEIRPEELLSYSWTDAEHRGELDSTVTWTLRAEGSGTRLFVEHRGFDPDDPIQQKARDLMSGGWSVYLSERLVAALGAATKPHQAREKPSVEASERVEISVRLAAEPQTVFLYLTQSQLSVRWMGMAATLDPVPGGLYSLTMGDGFQIAGTYLEVKQPQRVVTDPRNRRTRRQTRHPR